MSDVDRLSVAHVGTLRATPPGTGAQPQRDGLLRVHLGWLAIRTGDEPVVDDSFCAVLEASGDFAIATRADDSFCAALALDEPFDVATSVDGSFCVVLVDDAEVQL